MTTPWPIPMHQDLIQVTQDEIARTSRHAAQLREVRLHRRRLRAVLAALRPVRRARPSFGVAEKRAET
jgi:hypothetical protein